VISTGFTVVGHVHPGPGDHPAPCTMGTGSLPGVKRPGRGADHIIARASGVTVHFLPPGISSIISVSVRI
jgi:hypothetical protein